MEPILQEGAAGEWVKLLQRQLRDVGCYQGVVAGVWNQQTTDAVVYFQQTHLGPDHRPLAVDGVVGGQTWWALGNANGQSLALEQPKPTKLSERRARLLAIAAKYHGTTEDPPGSNRGKLIDLWTGQTGDGQGPPWCQFFVSACWYELLKTHPLGVRLGSCARAVELAMGAGKFMPREGTMPTPGDQFVMLYELQPGRGHTGFVTGVEVIDGKATRISTIEGNCSNRVARRIRDISTIYGFIDIIGKPREFTPGLGDGTKTTPSESTR